MICPIPVNKGLSKVPTYEPGKPIEELERELGLKGVVKMASNENPFGPSPKALRALYAHIGSVNRYPDGGAFYLRQALRRRFKIEPDRIILGNGSDELIIMALKAFLAPGEEALMARPTFLIYRIGTLVQGGVPVEIPMKQCRYDLSAMADAVTSKTRIVFIANPDNPMGTYVTEKELDAFVDRVPKNCLIFIDEAYYEFAAERKDYPRSFRYLDLPNVILARTFSKAYGLSGLRVGYGFTSESVARFINKVREPFNVNSLAQAAAVGALEDKAFLKKVIRTTEREKRLLARKLRALGVEVLDSATNFLLLKIGLKALDVYRELLRNGIIVRSLAAWGMPEALRVTIGKPGENRLFLKKFAKVLKLMKGRKSA